MPARWSAQWFYWLRDSGVAIWQRNALPCGSMPCSDVYCLPTNDNATAEGRGVVACTTTRLLAEPSSYSTPSLGVTAARRW
ncbi:hypothetical protein FHY18_004099 [Xanthomonas arboricola]|nr:hypothetical protein [Xanthomonas sp. 3793]